MGPFRIDDGARQAYIESRLGGKAAKALTPYLRDSHPDKIDSSDKLLRHLYAECHNPMQEERAKDDVDDLVMGNNDDFAQYQGVIARSHAQVTVKHENLQHVPRIDGPGRL
jgi:hypothetical protein